MARYSNIPTNVRMLIAGHAGTDKNAVALRSVDRQSRAESHTAAAFMSRLRKVLSLLEYASNKRVCASIFTGDGWTEYQILWAGTGRYILKAAKHRSVTQGQVLSFFSKLSNRVHYIEVNDLLTYYPPEFDLYMSEIVN